MFGFKKKKFFHKYFEGFLTQPNSAAKVGPTSRPTVALQTV